MRKVLKLLLVTILSLILFSSLCHAEPLFDYVNKPDGVFKWELVSNQEFGDVSIYELNLDSQVWKGIIWTHKLIIGVPKNLFTPDTALLLVTGSWKGFDNEELQYIYEVARGTGSVSAVLFDVPNQPLFGNLREDALIAYTFTEFAKNQDSEWLLLLPMTKSVVKAMDATQEFLKKELDLEIKDFVVTGGSKRGWTTWLTGACDSRVKGIAPMVYDNLNLITQLKHQKEIWGDYSPQISDYTSRSLMDFLDDPLGKSLTNIVDPYSYVDRIAMPKLIINGSNDPYWAIDAINFYFKDLVGEKYILYVPNSGHELQDRERVIQDISAFYLYLTGKIKFPQLSWKFEEDKSSITLTLASDIQPVKVGAWYAISDTKNFTSSIWKYVEAEPNRDNYIIKVEKPKDKNIALFGEFHYRIKDLDFYLCTTSLIGSSTP